MNQSMIALFATLLSAPALVGLLNGSVGPDQAGVRVLFAVLCAVVAEGLVRRFVNAVRPAEPTQPATAGSPNPDDDHPRRRSTDR